MHNENFNPYINELDNKSLLQIKEYWSKPEITIMDISDDTEGVNHAGADFYGSSIS